MIRDFFNKGRIFAQYYAGLSFYWAWVFLSFNSSTLTVQGGEHEILPLVHVVSSLAAMLTFGGTLVFHHKIRGWGAKRIGRVLVACSLCAGAGTILYTFPGFAGNEIFSISGAVLSGITCSTLILAWGFAYRNLGARDAVLFTSLTFFGAALLYGALSYSGAICSSLGVSLCPLVAALSVVYSLKQQEKQQGASLSPDKPTVWTKEVAHLLRTGLSWRVLIGLAAALFVCGGVRVYFTRIAPMVYGDPFLMFASLALAASIFFLYGMVISRTSLNLGILYRVAMPLFALALIVIALFGGDNAPLAFFALSTASVLFEILTWALLVEIARTTHYSPFLIFAAGRLAVHVGMVLGGILAFAMIDEVLIFALIAVGILIVSAGFTFTDKDTTFFFEPPTSEELKHLLEKKDSGSPTTHSSFQSALLDSEGESIVDEDLLIQSNLVGHIEAMTKKYTLSPREKEVFALWVTGRGSKYIQETLVISGATVKTHLRHIYEKCNVHNRAELMEKLEETYGKQEVYRFP